uniref:Uncharacterized protein n=1 Tax=viral metagenome TaxID=1070528 RepID=A0A6M3XYW6_9ZZZZ
MIPLKIQSKSAKQALVAAGFQPLSVRCGTGTARCWLEVSLPSQFTGRREEAENIIRKAANREDWTDDCILVDFKH